MTGPGPLAFPGSRTLAGWWRQLTSWQPRGVWVGHLLLHHVEALAQRTQSRRPDELDLLVLKALALGTAAPLERVDERLHLGPLLLQVLRRLAGEGLVQEEASGWAPTELGRQTLERGTYPRTVHERRSFHFLVGEQPGSTPQFIHLSQPATTTWAPGEDWSFDVRLLSACVAQPPEWKQRRVFPLDVERIIGTGEELPSWQSVLFDRPERLSVLLLVAPAADGEQLLAFVVRPEGWLLQTEAPVFTLGAGWAEALPDLAEPMPEEAWRQAWRTWCQPRGLAAVSGEGMLKVEGHQLIVTASARLVERLRTTRSDALRDEAWVLAGTGRIRRAALLKVVEAGSGTTPPP